MATATPFNSTANAKAAQQQQLLFLEEALEKLNFEMDSSGNSTTVQGSDCYSSGDDASEESESESDYDSDSDSDDAWSIEDDEESKADCEGKGRYQNHLLTTLLSKSTCITTSTKNAAVSLQAMIHQAEQAMAMSMLRAQQEKQGATHDVTDVTGPGLKKTSSVANFQCMGHIKKGIPPALRGDRREGLKRNLSITNFQAMGHTPKTKYEDGMTKSATVPAVQSPEDNFVSLLDRTDPGWLAHDSTSLEGFFLESKPEHLAAWDTDLVRAIRDHDLDALRARNTTTQSLQASNAFGESIVHLCARRETAEMLRFLVERT